MPAGLSILASSGRPEEEGEEEDGSGVRNLLAGKK
jgi:hypothetical protein